MVPVSLRLKNFLSYGSQAKELDFTRFHVACLSGANGQGKSALLDAITWAVWGKTERGRGHASLVRTDSGQEPMRVEFVFDIERARYRVVRIYEKGVHRVELHHAGERSDSVYRPLSGTGVKETQKVIENVVGLDYVTFINSAYLLQGRSNEFTRGSPGERKEILGKILNLQRYEKLREQATKEKVRASATVDSAQAVIDKLTIQIEKAPKLKSSYDKLKRAAARQDQELSKVGSKLQELVHQLSQLEGWEEQAANLDEDIAQLSAQIDESKRDKKRVGDLLNKADAMIGQEKVIRCRFEKKAALEMELQVEEHKRDTYQELAERKTSLDQKLMDTENTLEKQLVKQDSQQDALKQQLRKLEEAEARRPDLKQQLNQAREAQSVAKELRITKEKVDRLEKSISTCKLELEKEHLSLSAKLREREESRKRLSRKATSASDLAAQWNALAKKVRGRPELENRQQATEQKGHKLRAQKDTMVGRVEAWTTELAERNKQIFYLEKSEAGKCPTCGIKLSPTRRTRTLVELKAAAKDLKADIQGGKRKSKQLKGDINELRDQYKSQANLLKQLDLDQEVLAGLAERVKVAEGMKVEAQRLSREIGRIQQQLDDKAYKQDVQAKLEKLQQQLHSTEFSSAQYDEAVTLAGRVELLENQLKNIATELREKPLLNSRLDACMREKDRLERQLQGGAGITTLIEKIEQVDRQMDALGYDQTRRKTIRKELWQLSEAKEDLVRLEKAMEARPEYLRRIENLEREIRNATAKREKKRRDRQSYLNALAGKPAIEEALAAGRREQHKMQQELGVLNTDIGKVEEKLEQIGRSITERKSARERKSSAEEEVVIYGHLQKAFSRRGIPSLIIEQSVHEIEQRANHLLGRLTDGRMRVEIQMLAEKVTGGTRETLEIRVSDELGAYRPYETYSGGEAFRINFALRIALSQLLTARSGVPIRMLVIDEGFGTQDEQGIQCVVDAIAEVRRDFEKILIITHLEAVKDAFPVRIEVAKDPVSGSGFDLIGV